MLKKERKVGVREMKMHFSKYLRLVQKGMVIKITYRGEEVADLSSPSKKPLRWGEEYARLSLLADQGLMRLPEDWGKPLPPPLDIPVNRGKPASQIVIEDRR